MAFNQKEWEARLEKAQTQDEFSALIMELPDRPLHEISKERREFFAWEDEMIAKLVSSKKREET